MTRLATGFVTSIAAATLLAFSPASQSAFRNHEDEALNAGVPLTKAVTSGEQAGNGKVIGVEFDVEHGRPIWEVKVLGATGVNEYKVDASSGQVVQVEREHIRGKIATVAKGLKLDQLQATAMPLSQAVSTAEQKLGGKAVKVEVEHEHHAVQYDVFVRQPGKTQHMKIEAGGARTS